VMSRAIDVVWGRLLQYELADVQEVAYVATFYQDVMFRYNLGRLWRADYVCRNVDLRSGDGTVVWRYDLLRSICLCNFCHASAPAHRYSAVVGQVSDIDTVERLFELLTREITRLGELGWATASVSITAHPLAWKNAFRRGAVIELANALHEQFRQSQAADERATALVAEKDKGLELARERLLSARARA
jgi:hypothetical protein